MGQRGKGTTRWILCTTRTIRRRWLAGCRTFLRALAYLDQHLRVGKRYLVGQGEAGIWCLFARALASGVGNTVGRLGRTATWETTKRGAERFLRRGFARWAMCGRRWCCARRDGCWCMGLGGYFPERVARRCYRAAGKGTQLVVEAEGMSEDAIVEWIN